MDESSRSKTVATRGSTMILIILLVIIVFPMLVTAQSDDDVRSPGSTTYSVPDEMIEFGLRLRNRGDSTFWFEQLMSLAVPSDGEFTYNRQLENIPSRCRVSDTAVVAIADTIFLPQSVGAVRLFVEHPTYRDTVALVVSQGRGSLIVNLDTMSVARTRFPDCYRSDVWDTVDGWYRRSQITNITVGLETREVYQMIGWHGWHGWVVGQPGVVRWVLDNRESLYMKSENRLVTEVWIGPSE